MAPYGQYVKHHMISIVQGSGKTLAFGLPILQLLHGEAPAAVGDPVSADSRQSEAAAETERHQDASVKPGHSPLKALILEPTRELAIQVIPTQRLDRKSMHSRLPCITPHAPPQTGDMRNMGTWIA